MIEIPNTLNELEESCANSTHLHAIIIGTSDLYFPYLLVLLENIRQQMPIEAYKIIIVFDHEPHKHEINILDRLGHSCICLNINILKTHVLLKSLLHYSYHKRYSYGVFSRYLPYYFSKFFNTSTNIDIDSYIHQDITPILDKLATTSAHFYKLRSYYDNHAAQLHAYSSLFPDLMRASSLLQFIHAGMSTVTHKFYTNGYSDNFLEGLVCFSTKWNNITDTNFIYEELLISYTALKSNIKITPYPAYFNITFGDIAPYANNQYMNIRDVYVLHTAYYKLWKYPDLAFLFSNYINYKNIVLSKLKKSPELYSYEENIVKSLSFEETNIYNITNLISIYYIYRFALPTISMFLSKSNFFYIKDTKSYDRLILWSKHIPEYFRTEIISLTPDPDPSSHLIALVLRYNKPNTIFESSNSDCMKFPYCTQLEFFNKMTSYFAKSKLYIESNRIYVSIPFNLKDLPKALNKLELYLSSNIDEYLNL